MKVAIGAGNGGGFPRGAAPARGDSPALAITARCFAAVATASLLGASFAVTGRRAGISRSAAPAPRGFARLALRPPAFSAPDLRARATPGRFARAPVPTANLLLLELLMSRARETLLSAKPACQLSSPPRHGKTPRGAAILGPFPLPLPSFPGAA
jgi:hypothetical protein